MHVYLLSHLTSPRAILLGYPEVVLSGYSEQLDGHPLGSASVP